MRIGFFSWETKNSVAVGGVAEVVTNLACALAKLGHEVHVFTRIGHGQQEHELINGVYEHRCVSPACEDFIEYMDHVCDSMVSCFHFVESTYGKFDVLHAHDWHVVNAMANIKKNKGYDFAWTAHSTEFGRNGNMDHDNWFSGRVRYREWLGGYLSKVVTTVSYTMKDELHSKYKVPRGKTRVVYNGINPSDFRGKVDTTQIKENYGIESEEPVVLFMGRMCHQKGPDLLVEAVPEVVSFRNDTQFIFAGGGGDMINHVNGRAHYLGIGDNVHTIGYVSDNTLKCSLFKSCDMVCVPSRNEPFGIITLEAWAASKPVVATDVGGPREIIDNFYNGIKVYQTPESIAWGIKYLLGDPTGESMRRMGENAKKTVRQFTWTQTAKRYIDIYDEL
ncbi:MAG: glycosyltransferase family 4 protein [Candidatus Altiarchaeota archaeon]|nr:glycosyltransferase family 4 protein [Candidatus Altiarchaeota archaeon]